MTANPDKSTWVAQTLTYLGHRVGQGLVKVPEARIAAIKNYKQPVTKRDLRTFLGSWATIAPLSLILLVVWYPYIMP